MSEKQTVPDRTAIELRGHPGLLVWQDSGRNQTISFHDTGAIELPMARWLIQFIARDEPPQGTRRER